MNQQQAGLVFALFSEIGIIDQLSRTELEKHLPDGLIAPHFAVLNHLIRVRDGATPLQMARAFQVPKTSMTHTLAGLAKHGLIDMRPNPDDARSKQVWLTDAGRQMRDESIARMGPAFAAILAPLDIEELASALPVLTKLRQIMDAARD